MNQEEYDYINPKHYVGEDGRQTWERMIDKWGVEKTALWCEMTAFKYEDCRIKNQKPGEDRNREEAKIKWYKDKAAELYVYSNYLDTYSRGNLTLMELNSNQNAMSLQLFNRQSEDFKERFR